MQRRRQFARRTREFAEYQDAALVVACAHEFLGDQIHAVVKTSDVAHIAGSQELEYVRWFVVMFKDDHGTVIAVPKRRLIRSTVAMHLGAALSIRRQARPAGFGNLQQDDAFPRIPAVMRAVARGPGTSR